MLAIEDLKNQLKQQYMQLQVLEKPVKKTPYDRNNEEVERKKRRILTKIETIKEQLKELQ